MNRPSGLSGLGDPQVRIDQLIHAGKIEPINHKSRFLASKAWRYVRTLVFDRDGRVCANCKGVDRLCVDHIKPYSRYESLRLDPVNLQVLCWSCNTKKAAR